MYISLHLENRIHGVWTFVSKGRHFKTSSRSTLRYQKTNAIRNTVRTTCESIEERKRNMINCNKHVCNAHTLTNTLPNGYICIIENLHGLPKCFCKKILAIGEEKVNNNKTTVAFYAIWENFKSEMWNTMLTNKCFVWMGEKMVKDFQMFFSLYDICNWKILFWCSCM